MKKLIVIIFMINFQGLFSQEYCENYCLTFDDTVCLSHLNIDTIPAPQNLWQIGMPHKVVIDSASYPSKAIITDTLDPYPVNNYSVFTVTNLATEGDIYGFRMIQGIYYVESDSLKDFGRMEFSPDYGISWIDLIKDTIYNANIQWLTMPVLTGHSFTAKYFELIMIENGSVFNIELGDTLTVRFTFISDSTFDNLSGLMYDDLCFWDFVEGISEIRFKPVKSRIYPNPSDDAFTIEFDNPREASFQLAIYDINSKLLLTKEDIASNQISLHLRHFSPGTYVYKLTNLRDRERAWGKFIKSGQ